MTAGKTAGVAAYLATCVRYSAWALLGLCSMAAAAQESPDDWRWFDVEVLVFKHTATDHNESFPWHPPRQFDATNDLLSSFYAPNFRAFLHALDVCPTQQPTRPVFCAEADELDPNRLWYSPERIMSGFARAPATVVDGFGGDMYRQNKPFLLPKQTFEFNEFREQLVRRNVGEPLLHATYRTPVFNRTDDYTVRLFGGRNFGQEFLPNGYEQPPFVPLKAAADDSAQRVPQVFEEIATLFERIEQQELFLSYRDHRTPNPPPLLTPRARTERPMPVWELDGLLHIYLVGNYLHIDSDLELREPQQVRFNQRELAAQVEQALQPQLNSTFLRSYRLNQLRRVISHETHYFDHPRFGLVVQIRRTELSARR